MRYLVTKKCDGSIVDFGYVDDDMSVAEEVFKRNSSCTAVTLDMNNGTRIRYERR